MERLIARPCPFCGGPPVLFSRMDGTPPECAEAYVFCHECGAQGPTVDSFWDVAIDPTQKDMGIAAVIAWNKSDARNAELYGVALSTFDKATGLRAVPNAGTPHDP